ncbi:MAG TPA: response regulator, partial [Steroidobacteraceae bacterium]|nr:response regulator [Steroidobacteraceae bacterium]
MAHKRALIVDDSRSARLFLARILEKHQIEVDSVESAEAAIGYLASRRPDVIFMDHMMPGMDGFQAVQAIKNDLRTATIPIMMYTSQEGEVYLGQARALGAVGVLPKQIKHADVSKVLYQLHLIADRRSEEQTTFKPLEAVMPHVGREGAGREHGGAAASARAAVGDAPLRQPHAHGTASGASFGGEPESVDSLPALRRWLYAGLEAQTDRITAEVQALLAAERGAHGSGWVAGVAVVACAAALIAAGFSWSDHGRLQAARTELLQLQQVMASRSVPPPAAVP